LWNVICDGWKANPRERITMKNMFDKLNSMLPQMPKGLSEKQLSAIKLGVDVNDPEVAYEENVNIIADYYEHNPDGTYNTHH
jgi:hypothetical protein